MSFRPMMILILLSACAGAPPGDKDTTDLTDLTDSTTDDAGTDPASTDDQVDTDVADAFPGTWSGTYTVSWAFAERDWSFPGPGELINNIVDGCSSGSARILVDGDGAITTDGPMGACNPPPTRWKGISLTGTATGLDTEAPVVSGELRLLQINKQTGDLDVLFGHPFTGAFSESGGDPLGQLTLSGSRAYSEGNYYDNFSFNVVLSPMD